MSPTTIGRCAARATVRVMNSISSMDTGTVDSCPSTTIAAVSPTRMTSIPAVSANREPVRVADRRQYAQLHGYVQVAHNATHDRDLLRVFLAEVRDVRPHDVEQLQADRRNTAEMAGS